MPYPYISIINLNIDIYSIDNLGDFPVIAETRFVCRRFFF